MPDPQLKRLLRKLARGPVDIIDSCDPEHALPGWSRAEELGLAVRSPNGPLIIRHVLTPSGRDLAKRQGRWF